MSRSSAAGLVRAVNSVRRRPQPSVAELIEVPATRTRAAKRRVDRIGRTR